MREGPSPYRGAERAAGPRLVVHPLLLKRLLALLLVVAVAPAVLYATLWSRTVSIACAPATGRAFRCETREEAILGADVEQREIPEIVSVHLAGVTEGTRGDAWIEVVTFSGTVPLTRGLNVAKGAQREAAAQIEAHVIAGDGPFTVSFGSRYTYLFMPIGGWLAALFGLVVLGMRASITVDRAHRLLVVVTRRFPFRAKRSGVALDELEGFRWTMDKGGRPRVEAVLRSGEGVALFLAHGLLVEGIVARLAAMLRAAREE